MLTHHHATARAYLFPPDEGAGNCNANALHQIPAPAHAGSVIILLSHFGSQDLLWQTQAPLLLKTAAQGVTLCSASVLI